MGIMTAAAASDLLPFNVHFLCHLKASFERQTLGKLIFRVRHYRWDRIYFIGNVIGELVKLQIVELKFLCSHANHVPM
jgi:hypothetical protein